MWVNGFLFAVMWVLDCLSFLCAYNEQGIKNWFNNHGLNKGKQHTRKSQSVAITLQPSSARLLSEQNMHSKLYYNQHVKPAMDSEIGDQKISHAERFTIVNKHLNQIYEAKPEEFKESIHDTIEKERKAREAEKGISQSVIAGDEKMGPEEYLLYVLNSPVTGQRFICD